FLSFFLSFRFYLLIREREGDEERGRDPAERVVGLSGHQLLLRPPRPETAHINSVKWKMKHDSTSEASVILTWKNGSGLNYVQRALNDFNNTLNFIIEDLALLIKASQHNYSGLYTLEVTDDTGKVNAFLIRSLLPDHVGTLEVAEERKVLDGGKCQVSLSCSVSRGGNVSYVWYRGNELIQTPDNLGKLEQEIEVGNLSVVTCNVSNPASWVNHTFTHSCQSVDNSVNFLMIIVILLVILLLVALTGFCVWRRKRKQSEMSPAEPLTVYEDVKNTQNRRNQVRRTRGRGVWTSLEDATGEDGHLGQGDKGNHTSVFSKILSPPVCLPHQPPSSSCGGKAGNKGERVPLWFLESIPYLSMGLPNAF
uniref:Ig-like domain-containing protein n=1 Tax=Ursus americanus TaxID=9643 RepID=A0A452SLJ2_URSAM